MNSTLYRWWQWLLRMGKSASININNIIFKEKIDDTHNINYPNIKYPDMILSNSNSSIDIPNNLTLLKDISININTSLSEQCHKTAFTSSKMNWT